ncbi:MAG: HAD family hydrolase [Candidatus Kapabacteria bacterium]|nr:HAD family hydrolase [Candidatus Kapabacteria bacterium]
MDLIILDIDGTLTDTEHVDEHSIVGALEEVLGVSDLSTDWTMYRTSTDGGIVAEVVERVHGSVRQEVVEDVTKRFYGMLEDHYTTSPDLFAPMPGARDVLATLREMGYCVAIATGCWRESALFKLRVAGIEHVGVPLATADDSHDRAEILRRAIDLAQQWNDIQGFRNIWYVGDGVWDARAAATLGIGFIGIAAGQKADRLRAEGATIIVDAPADVTAVLRQSRARQTASHSSTV